MNIVPILKIEKDYLSISTGSILQHFEYTYACKWGDFITTGKTRMECINKMLEIAKEL